MGWEGNPADRSLVLSLSLELFPAFMAAVAGLGIEVGTAATVVGEG